MALGHRLLVCSLLWDVSPVPGKTLNAVLLEKMTAHLPLGTAMSTVTLFSEGILLVVAARAGFLDRPRVLSNCGGRPLGPVAALSERLTTGNGIVLTGPASLGALLYTRGDVAKIVIMYGINVFLTFSLSLFGMARKTFAERRATPFGTWVRPAATFVVGSCCAPSSSPSPSSRGSARAAGSRSCSNVSASGSGRHHTRATTAGSWLLSSLYSASVSRLR